MEVTVRIRPDRIGWLRRAVGDRSVDAAVTLPADDDPDGWTHLRLRLDWPEEVPALLLAVGSHLELLDPPEMRERLVAIASAVVGRYAGSA